MRDTTQRPVDGRVELAGVEYIPENERDSRPMNVFLVFFSCNLAFGSIVFGWLPVTFGLNFVDTMTSSVLGLFLGTILVAPLGLLGPRIGTSMTVSSGAHFGVRGRCFGSAITILFSVSYAAIAVWTSGDAVVAVAARAVGAPSNTVVRAVAYGAIAIGVVVVALFGHGMVVRIERFLLPIMAVLLLAGVVAFAPKFSLSAVNSGDYLLGSFWPTWVLQVVLSIGGPLSTAAGVGDFTRRISSRHRDRNLYFAVGFGLFGGLLITSAFGTFTAMGFAVSDESYVTSLVSATPAWWVMPILAIGLLGGLGQGSVNLYSAGLNLGSLLHRLSRPAATLAVSIVAVALLYVGVFVGGAVDSITTMCLILNGISAPWVAINLVGFYVARRRQYEPMDLQVYATGERGGRYWFVGGWNPRAVVALMLGAAFGLLAVECPWYSGPLASMTAGVDVSVIGAVVVSSVAYLLALWWFPEDSVSVPVALPTPLPLTPGES